MDGDKNALLIFVKNPIKGAVKTRLASTIGDDEALRAYKLMLLHLRSIISVMPHTARRHKITDIYIYYDSRIPRHNIWPEDVKLKLQTGGDIGERMSAAFRQMCPRYNKCVLIGSDCPSIRMHHFWEAFDVLEEKQVVLGPSEDGGYYLVGMQELQEVMFSNIEWSTTGVLQSTELILEKQDLSYGFIDTLKDVDYEDDYREVNQFLEENYADKLTLYKSAG